VWCVPTTAVNHGPATTLEPRRRGRPPTVTRDEVIDAAVTVLDREGFEAVAIRSVAKELGMDPRSLYTYVAGVDELRHALAVRVVGTMLGRHDHVGPQRESVLAVYRTIYETSCTHPDLLAIVFNAPDELIAAALPSIDAVIGYLRGEGLSPARTWFVYRSLYMFCLGHGAMERTLRAQSGAERSRHLMGLLETPGFQHSEVRWCTPA
jgi:TetR/AcrR family transcriptional regulator, tetracycline repressor protein